MKGGIQSIYIHYLAAKLAVYAMRARLEAYSRHHPLGGGIYRKISSWDAPTKPIVEWPAWRPCFILFIGYYYFYCVLDINL